jgi:D-sedoheptulose 7-phosphate isomerase
MPHYRELFRQVAANMATVADSDYPDAVARAAELIHRAFANGRKLLVFGNGGSSADAQHFAAEFVGRFAADRAALPAIALAANQAMLTAWSNDRSFEDIFAREIEALGAAGDVAFGISTSGRSPNVINALQRAREMGLTTIGLTGHGGGAVAQHADVLLAVPLKTTARIQEVHLVTYHAICAEIESRIAGQSSRAIPSSPSASS